MSPARKKQTLVMTAHADSQELRLMEWELAAESQAPRERAHCRSCDVLGARAGEGLPKPLKAPQ